MVKRNKTITDLNDIQLLFPCDNLRLQDQDPLGQRKTLYRTKSVNAFRFQKSFPNKLKFSYSVQPTNQIGRQWTASPSLKEQEQVHRTFLMSSDVQFTVGMQRHQRYIFLFDDLFLVAKSRSATSYRLKEKIRLCELWLADCSDHVWESAASDQTSFVIGWPTTNVVVTFSSEQARNAWYYRLQDLIDAAKDKELPSVLTIQVLSKNSHKKDKQVTLRVTNRHTAYDCIILVLKQLESYDEIHHYQLWAKTGKDGNLYPLIGHEYPFNIKMNSIRRILQRSQLNLSDLDNTSNDAKCYFILRRCVSENNPILGTKTRNVKSKRNPFAHWPFWRHSNKQNTDQEEELTYCSPPGQLFGQPLDRVCQQSLPKPIVAILDQLYHRGPHTLDVFRRSSTIQASKELRMALDKNPDYNVEANPVIVLACVLKDYLRCLPDCLFTSELYREWLETVEVYPDWKRRDLVISLLNKLPPNNVQLMRHLFCVLWRISQRSAENKMTSYNLAVCVGPTLLCPANISDSFLLSEDISKKTPKLISYLIDNWPLLFCDERTQTADERHDSGAEESESLQNGGFRRDDSSVDSLDREYLERNPKLSLTNLSRDSGLTLSDTQLYNELEDYTKSVPQLSTRSGTCHQVVRKRILARTDKTSTPVKWCYTSQNANTSVKSADECLLQKRPALHQKGRAPSPPSKPKQSSPHPRRLLYGQRADRHAVWFAHHCRSPGWKRSQSTSQIDLIDSDDENTPPSVSRSSSLIRDLSTLKMNVEKKRQEQTTLSARARQLYEESVRLYNEQLAKQVDETHRAVLVKVDSGKNLSTPPLPPKHHPSLQRTVSESATVRLRHLPPVHVSDEQLVQPYRNRTCEVSPEISWSVAQLRATFGQPPPYRPPPPPVTRTLSIDSKNSEEESFV